MAKPLTTKAVQNAKPTDQRYEVPDVRISGLFLVVHPSGAKSWAWRYRYLRKPKKLTIGPAIHERKEERVPLLGEAHTLSEARTAAERAASLLAEGTDPSSARQSDAAADRAGKDTVAYAIQEYLDRYVVPNNRPKTQAVVRTFLNGHAKRVWGDRKLKSIVAADVREFMRNLSVPTIVSGARRGGPGAARLGYSVLSRFFGWCVHEGMVPVSPLTGTRPPTLLPSRERVLSDREIANLWAATESIPAPFGPMFRILLLTGQRRDEVAQMRWSELDLDAGLWVMPSQRTKNGKSHAVPLTELAVAIIRSVPRLVDEASGKLSPFVFTTTGSSPVSGFSKAKARLDREMSARAQVDGLSPDWRLHDIRRTVASGMARLGQPIHVVEAVLNHQSGTISGVAAVYIRHNFLEEKRVALEEWASLVGSITTLMPSPVGEDDE
jgi:integrase